jgi:excisionase family DNA binding protein
VARLPSLLPELRTPAGQGADVLIEVGGKPAAVVIDARFCAFLERYAHLSALQVQVRGVHPEVSQQLLDVRTAAKSRNTNGTELAKPEEHAPTSEWLTVSQAAQLLGVGPRAVRQAITRGRLEAEHEERGYRIRRIDAQHYRATRAT